MGSWNMETFFGNMARNRENVTLWIVFLPSSPQCLEIVIMTRMKGELFSAVWLNHYKWDEKRSKGNQSALQNLCRNAVFPYSVQAS